MKKVGTILADGIPLWQCESCGGPAVWTFIRGETYYHCERQCDGFSQMELWDSDGVGQLTRSGDAQDAGRTPHPNDEPDGLPF